MFVAALVSRVERSAKCWYDASMQSSITLPDDLYDRVEARRASLGRSIDEVAAEAFEHWLEQDRHATSRMSEIEPEPGPVQSASLRSRAESWLDDWLRMGAESSRSAPSGPSAREIHEEGRNRLESR